MLKLFANIIWIRTPNLLQKLISRFFSYFFEIKISRFMILPYCVVFGLSTDYLDQFESETGETSYKSYSDFFRRKYKNNFKAESSLIWPCEGYVCDWGPFNEKSRSTVKGQNLNLNTIFETTAESTKNHYFINIFLHNHNYHRIHSPVQGTLKNVHTIPGDLIFLRPWFYTKKTVSYPAVRNERMVFEIVDGENKTWYLALVGGFGVGTIEISKNINVNSPLNLGEEIAKFKLGSTVCIASPYKISIKNYLETVQTGQKINIDLG